MNLTIANPVSTPVSTGASLPSADEQAALDDQLLRDLGIDLSTVDLSTMDAPAVPEIPVFGRKVGLQSFVSEFGDDLLAAVGRQNPPVYVGVANVGRAAVMKALLRQPFPEQATVIQATCALLCDQNQPSAVINGEMGTGKTLMAIAAAAAMHAEGYERALVICPPHLVYKWRREIKQTVLDAKVWILNGDTLKKLLALRLVREKPTVPEFFVMGRVRMRLGFNWEPAFTVRTVSVGVGIDRQLMRFAACADCASLITSHVVDDVDSYLSVESAKAKLGQNRMSCTHCGSRLWTLTRKGGALRTHEQLLMGAIKQLPTIGDKTAAKLVETYGLDMLAGMLEDNVHEFLNLMDEDGELVFNDRQAKRMERAMAGMEFSFGAGGYQPTEFIKRYLPQSFFGVLIGDEGHEFKNEGSAQGQAFGVLVAKCKKAILLTGTLMGGYADDLFFLLHRLNPGMMIEDGFAYDEVRNSLGSASMAFLREHGIVKDIFRSTSGTTGSHRTSKGTKQTHRTAKGPGFGPKGIMRYVLPITAFLKLNQISGNVLPPYEEFFIECQMSAAQADVYRVMSATLKLSLQLALRGGDHSLLGVVLNALLAWPDCTFRDEVVRHPHRKTVLFSQKAMLGELEASTKEENLIALCLEAKERGRKCLVYTVYSGTRDTTARLKTLLSERGLKVAVLRATVDAAKREDWICEQVERGVDVVVTNPELVKTGLDLLDFPTIAYMQSGYNVYTLMQASRRSWRIGQRQNVEVYFLGYADTAQEICLQLMAKKIAVSQSTSGDMPECGLDVLNDSGDSIEVALAKQLLAA